MERGVWCCGGVEFHDPNSEPFSAKPSCFQVVPAWGSQTIRGQCQANYLCFLSTDGNRSGTHKISSINKCRGLIAQPALAQEVVERRSGLFHLWLQLARDSGNPVFSALGEVLWWPSSTFLVEKYLLCANWSPLGSLGVHHRDSLSCD